MAERRIAAFALLAGLVVAGSAPVAAQGAAPATPRLTWALDGLRAGYCLHFLMDPAQVGRTPFAAGDLVPLSEAAGVHPALRRVASDAPEYASWIPSAICTYHFDSTRRGGRAQRDRRGRPQGIAVWKLAARGGGAIPADLMASNYELGRQAIQPALRIGLFKTAARAVPESDQQEYTTRIGKTIVTWSGALTADSSLAAALPAERWRLRGTQGSVWTAEPRIQPTSASRMSGAVRIEGKTDLARMLQASPIRWMSAFSRGGSGEVAFFR